MTTLRLEIPAKMIPFATKAKRHKIARGGRGSGKSWSVARILAAKGYAQPIRWLCCREIQKSIKESSHRLLADQIQAMGLGSFYEIQRDSIKGPNGTEFAFAGLQDHTADSVKSYEGFDGAWVEEAHTVRERSAQILIPTIRKPGSELWWTYNPENEEDFVHKMAEVDDENTLVVDINWADNPWFPHELDLERQKLERVNPELARHVWGGECRSSAGLIFKREWFKRYDHIPSSVNRYIASDYAVTPDDGDWTEHGVFAMDHGGNIYIEDWWSGQTSPDEWIDAWIRLCRAHKPWAAFEEKGVILRAVDSAITKRMRETQTYVRRVPLPSASSKAARALGFAARASAGTVYLPRTDWADRLLNQLCAFSGEDGRTDDMVDVCSLIGRGLDEMHNGSLPMPSRPQSQTDDYGVGEDEDVDLWKIA
jgi:predicted phage terminase large subunit-like protein